MLDQQYWQYAFYKQAAKDCMKRGEDADKIIIELKTIIKELEKRLAEAKGLKDE